MKKLISSLLIAMLLCGCSPSAPAASTQPSGNAAPTATLATRQPSPTIAESETPTGQPEKPQGNVFEYTLKNYPGVAISIPMQWDDAKAILDEAGVEYEHEITDYVLGLEAGTDGDNKMVNIIGNTNEMLHMYRGEIHEARWVNDVGEDLDSDKHILATIAELEEIPYYELTGDITPFKMDEYKPDLYTERYTFYLGDGEGEYVREEVHKDLEKGHDEQGNSYGRSMIYTRVYQAYEPEPAEPRPEIDSTKQDYRNARVFTYADPEDFSVGDWTDGFSYTVEDAVEWMNREYAEEIADEDWPRTHSHGEMAIYNGKPYIYFRIANLVKDEETGDFGRSSYAFDLYFSMDGKEILQGWHQRIDPDEPPVYRAVQED